MWTLQFKPREWPHKGLWENFKTSLVPLYSLEVYVLIGQPKTLVTFHLFPRSHSKNGFQLVAEKFKI